MDVDLDRGLAALTKIITAGLFGWLIHRNRKADKELAARPCMREIKKEIKTQIDSAKELTQVKLDHIKEDVAEMKGDIKTILHQRTGKHDSTS